MKKAYWIFATLAVALLCDRAGGWFLGKITKESQFRYSRLYNSTETEDVLFIGNSRGLSYYQPYAEEKTGLTTANLSYNGMPIDLGALLVKDYLDRHPAPKVLVVDISMMDSVRMDNKLAYQFNHYTPYSERLSNLLAKDFRNDFYAGKLSHLYRCNSEVFQRTFYYWKKSDKDWLLDRVISQSMVNDVDKQTTLRFHYSPKMMESLMDMVKYAQQKGTRVEMVVNPYFPAFLPKIGNLDSLMRDISLATGATVKDFKDAVTETEAFGDYQHVNKVGARLYLDKLIEAGVLK
ncbi:MAG: hypothetical protein K9J37_18715 [Saprospiraceae bacterium]|nr:hypothetical protein [Saprospiraceae bacterium]MCF8251955.1 hypothetical protein [Saprospiraceae bacterium]MCF8282917.1 hypothetical protein [Bacteroidales bacterium]MCF8313641.1 hypothetical protein [Saprospiraceae bacterium]MCF8442348.1 hypothetical protein [Saprospiraceae bacterium]